MSISTNIMGGEHAYQFIIGNTKIPLFYMPYENPNIMELTDKKEFQRTQTIGGQAFEHWGDQPQTMHVSMRIRKNSYAGNIIGVYNEKRYDLEDPMICTELEMMKMMYYLDRRKMRWTIGDQIGKIGNSSSSGSSVSLCSVATGKIGSIATGAISKGNVINTSSLNITDSSNLLSGKAKQNGNAVGNWLNGLSDTIIVYKSNVYSGFFTNFKVTEDGSFPFVNVVTFDFMVTGTTGDMIYDQITDSAMGRVIAAGVGAVTTATAAGYFVDSISTGVQSLFDGFI